MQRITALGVLGFLTYWTIQLFTLEYSQKQFIKSKIGEYDLSKGSSVWVYSDAVGRAVAVIAAQQVKWQFIDTFDCIRPQLDHTASHACNHDALRHLISYSTQQVKQRLSTFSLPSVFKFKFLLHSDQ